MMCHEIQEKSSALLLIEEFEGQIHVLEIMCCTCVIQSYKFVYWQDCDSCFGRPCLREIAFIEFEPLDVVELPSGIDEL